MSDPTKDPRFLRDPYPACGHAVHVPGAVPACRRRRTPQLPGPRKPEKPSATPGSRRTRPPSSRARSHGDPPRHTRLRRLVTKAFTTGAVAQLRPFIARVTDGLLDQWPAAEPFDFVAGLAVPLPVVVICELLGVPPADRSGVQRWSAELFAAGEPGVIDAASHAMADYMTALIAAKRRDPGSSLLDRLISARDGDDHLSEEELVSLAVLLLVAGHETTTNALGNAVLALLQHPAKLDRLRERIPTRSLPHWTNCFASTRPSARPPSGTPRKPSHSAAPRSRPVSLCWSLLERPTAIRSDSRRRSSSTWIGMPLAILASATASTAVSVLHWPKPKPTSPCVRF